MEAKDLSRYQKYKIQTSGYPELILGEYIPSKLKFGYMYKQVTGYDRLMFSRNEQRYFSPIHSIMSLTEFYQDRKVGITDDVGSVVDSPPIEPIRWIPVAGCFFSEPLANMSYSAIVEHSMENFTLDLNVGSFEVTIPTVKQYCDILNQTSHSNELLGHPYGGEGCWCKDSAPVMFNGHFFQGHYAVHDVYGKREISIKTDGTRASFLQFLLRPKALYSSTLIGAYYRSLERHEAFRKKSKEIGFVDDIYNEAYQEIDIDF